MNPNVKEKITESVKSFVDLQNEVMTNLFGTSPLKFTAPFENIPNPNEFYENTVKFHTACIQYHNSVLNILDSMNSLNLVNNKKNK
jgi:hypothetical protein